MPSAGEISVLLTANLAGFTNTLRRASAAVGRAGKSMEGSLGIASKAMIGFGAVSAIALAGIAVKSVSVAADFEQSMANVAAVSRATADEFKALEDTALQLGRTTIFTASQVAELEKEFAKLGFSTKEIIGAAEATLNLAAATGEDLASAAAVAGTTLRGFNIDASDTARVTDVMAESFASSALDMEKFRETMKLVAPIARAAGFSIEETTALMAKLADAGISGSLAGTALRQILSRLSDQSSDLNKAFSFQIRTFDDLVKGLKELKEANFDLATAAEFVDVRSRSAFLTLVNAADDLGALKTQFEDAAGAAEEMAEIMQDTLPGAVKATQSAFEGFFIEFDKNTGLTDTFQGLLIGLTGAVNALTDAMKLGREGAEDAAEGITKLSDASSGAIQPLLNLVFGILNTKKETDKASVAVIELEDDLNAFQLAVFGSQEAIDEYNTSMAKAEEETKKAAEATKEAAKEALKFEKTIVAASSVMARDWLPILPKFEEGLLNATQQIKALGEEMNKAFVPKVFAPLDIPEADTEGQFNILNAATQEALNKSVQIYSMWANTIGSIFTSVADARLREIRRQESESIRIAREGADRQLAEVQSRLERGVINQQQATDAIIAIERNKNDALKEASDEANEAEKKAFNLRKIGMIAQATASTALGVARALELAAFGVPIAIAIGVLGAIQIGIIASQKFAAGGIVRGPGGVDKVPILATAGEAVVRKEVVDSVGIRAVERFAQTGDTSGLGGVSAAEQFAQPGDASGIGGVTMIFNFNGAVLDPGANLISFFKGPGREAIIETLQDVQLRGA